MSQPSEMITIHAIVVGQVQGVGFRATVYQYAKNQNLTGTVQNLSDGSVEIYVIGLRPQLELFFKQMQAKFHITSCSINEVVLSHHFSDFSII